MCTKKSLQMQQKKEPGLLQYLQALVVGPFTFPKVGDGEGEMTKDKWVSKKKIVPVCRGLDKNNPHALRAQLAVHLLIKVKMPTQLKDSVRNVTITLKEVHLTARRLVDQQTIDQNPEAIAEAAEKRKQEREELDEKGQSVVAPEQETSIDQRSIHWALTKKKWGREDNMKALLAQINKDLRLESTTPAAATTQQPFTAADIENDLNTGANVNELTAAFAGLSETIQEHLRRNGCEKTITLEGDKSIKDFLG